MAIRWQFADRFGNDYIKFNDFESNDKPLETLKQYDPHDPR